MDLKWLLVRRIVLVALLCLLAGTLLVLQQTSRHAAQQNAELVQLVSKRLTHQAGRVGATEVPKPFPDWDPVASDTLQPGQCVELRGGDGTVLRARCAGADAATVATPKWFVSLYGALINPGLTATETIFHQGVPQGTIAAHSNPSAAATKVWETIAPLFALSSAILAALCVVTYLVIERALRPTKEILAALNRLALGDLSCRLPEYQLIELNRISEVFNALSADLSKATAERAELARRLVDTQEQERRHIARELHDDIAQKLSALNAYAACIRENVKQDAPQLDAEVRDLQVMISQLMVSLRGTLTYLRPQVIDDLGLRQSLQALVDDHNKSARGTTSYAIEVEGDVERLRAETSAHVYRIVQEALTNVTKHANARNVTVRLSRFPDTDPGSVRLSVLDDGIGRAAELPQQNAGSGLIGMRERVAALSGSFSAGPLPSGGFGLQIEFPTQQAGAGA